MEANLSSFISEDMPGTRIQAVETAVNLLATGFVAVDDSVNDRKPFNPIKVIADQIEEALGVENKEKQ